MEFALQALLGRKQAKIAMKFYGFLSSTKFVTTASLAATRLLRNRYFVFTEKKARKAKEKEKRKENRFDSVNFSLNFIENGTLRFRTLCEVPLDTLLQGDKQLADECINSRDWIDEEGKHPFVLWRIDKNHARSINMVILNHISEQVRRDHHRDRTAPPLGCDALGSHDMRTPPRCDRTGLASSRRTRASRAFLSTFASASLLSARRTWDSISVCAARDLSQRRASCAGRSRAERARVCAPPCTQPSFA